MLQWHGIFFRGVQSPRDGIFDVVFTIQVPDGRIPALKYLLLGMCGHMWLRPIVSGIKCHHFRRPWC
jgi:hypothetical protein